MADEVLQPGQLIRPVMTTETASRLVETLYGFKVTSITELNSYDDKNYKVKVDPEFTNPNVDKLWPHGYILKVLNSMDSRKNHIEAEHEVQHLLWAADIKCPQPVLDISGRDRSLQKIGPETNGAEQEEGDQKETGRMHTVRLLTFIPGRVVYDVDPTPLLLQKCGLFLAKFTNALKDFSHVALSDHQTVWNLKAAPQQANFLYAVKVPSRKSTVEAVLDAFSTKVLPNIDQFQKGVIHGDYNEQNILVTKDPDETGEHDLAALIDFGDMTDSYYIFEVAIAIMYMAVNCKSVDPITSGGHFLAGYLQERTLHEAEWRVLKECVAARYCQSLVMGAYSYSLDPGNEYLLVTAKAGWDQLERLWRTSKEQLYGEWFDIINKAQPNIELPPLENII